MNGINEETEETNTENKLDAEKKGGIDAEFIESFKNEFPDEIKPIENDSKDGKTPEIVDNGIDIDTLFELLPPDVVQNLRNAPEYLAYLAYTKNLDKDQKATVKDLFKAPDALAKFRQDIFLKLIKKHFPNFKGGSVPEELILAVVTLYSVKNCLSEAKGIIAEQNHLKDKKK